MHPGRCLCRWRAKNMHGCLAVLYALGSDGASYATPHKYLILFFTPLGKGGKTEEERVEEDTKPTPQLTCWITLRNALLSIFPIGRQTDRQIDRHFHTHATQSLTSNTHAHAQPQTRETTETEGHPGTAGSDATFDISWPANSGHCITC